MALDDIRQKNNCPKAVRFYSMTERTLEDKKNNRSKAVKFYNVVRTERLELSHLSAPEPKSGASTNFATSA